MAEPPYRDDAECLWFFAEARDIIAPESTEPAATQTGESDPQQPASNAVTKASKSTVSTKPD